MIESKEKKKLCRISQIVNIFLWRSTKSFTEYFSQLEFYIYVSLKSWKKKRKVVIDHHRWNALFLPRKYSKIFRKFPQVWQTLNTNIYQLTITFSFSDSNRKLQNSGTTLTRVQLICFVNSIRKSVDVSVELIFIVSRNIRDFYESRKSSIIREIHSFHAFRN